MSFTLFVSLRALAQLERRNWGFSHQPGRIAKSSGISRVYIFASGTRCPPRHPGITCAWNNEYPQTADERPV